MSTNNKMTKPSTQEKNKKQILFLCYHNSARSQMAEGLFRDMYGDIYEVYSAGIEAKDVDPRAAFVMREIAIDISAQRSKTFHEYQDMVFDLVVTVCDRAKQVCPICSTPDMAGFRVFNGQPRAKKVIHKSFEDPAKATGSEEDQFNVFRRIRDEIKEWISLTFE